MSELNKYLEQARIILSKIKRHLVVIVCALVVIIYGGLVYRITNLNSAAPSQNEIDSMSDPIRSSRVDPDTVSQLESLKDNSVSVQALFEQARNNPFSETN